MAAGVLVWSEKPELARELLGEARRLADISAGEVSLCVAGEIKGDGLQEFAANGADVVYVTDKRPLDASGWVAALGMVIAESQPGLVLIGATQTGMEVAPRVAERHQSAYAAWAVGVEIDPSSGVTTASCALYAGVGLATYRFSRSMTVLTGALGVFKTSELGGREAHVRSVVIVDGASQIKLVGEDAKVSGATRLQEAKAVVDIGRGVQVIEDLERVRSLASVLDAQLSCSRPVSSDRDWLPEWLGLSGAKVKPQLCLTIGISGAVQHMVGIRGSRVIAAVNIDENAAIFGQADIGVVADLTEFLPVLIERLEARGARPSWL